MLAISGCILGEKYPRSCDVLTMDSCQPEGSNSGRWEAGREHLCPASLPLILDLIRSPVHTESDVQLFNHSHIISKKRRAMIMNQEQEQNSAKDSIYTLPQGIGQATVTTSAEALSQVLFMKLIILSPIQRASI